MTAEVETWLKSCGLAVERVELDGEFHRVDGKKRGKKAGWYKGWETPVRACVAGDWSIGEKWEWRTTGAVSKETANEVRRLQQEAIVAAEMARSSKQEHIAVEIRVVLSLLNPAPRDHSYLAAKDIRPHGTLANGVALYVPNSDVNGTVWGAQRIFPEGNKRWHSGQRVAGTFFQIGELCKRAYICEGFATGASIYECTGATVFCAFAANNLKGVAVALAKKHPGVEWVIAGDDDFATDKNPGRSNAVGAAEAIGAPAIFPEFPDSGSRGTDFNDLMLISGRDEVRRQLQGKPMAKVTDLGEEKRKRQKKSGGDKLGKSELFRQIIAKMNRDPLAPPDWPDFPRRFHYVSDRTGRKAILEEFADEVIGYRDRDLVADSVLQYCWNQIPWVPGATGIDWEGAVKCRNMWLGLTPPLPAPPRVLSEKNQRGLTFKRLPFDVPTDGQRMTPPKFEGLLARFSKPLAVCAFIGSLFYPEADRQQYLFLQGHGGDSKGTLMRFLHMLFGDAAQSLHIPARDGDKFWNFSLYGKRLGLFYDTDPTDWFSKAHFKSITGGDPQPFEEKGRMGFTATPTVKFIVASNFKPQVSGGRADMRRLLHVFCKSVPDADRQSNFENVLMQEAPEIIAVCKEIYLEQCPKHAAIPCEEAREIAFATEAKYLDVFHRYFVIEPGSALRGETVRECLKLGGIVSDNEVGRLKATWERELGLAIDHGNQGTVYRGVALRANPYER